MKIIIVRMNENVESIPDNFDALYAQMNEANRHASLTPEKLLGLEIVEYVLEKADVA